MASLILPDINLLVYAHNVYDPRSAAADRWLADLLSGPDRACFCSETVHGFIRLVTGSAVMTNPLSLREAFSTVHVWLGAANSMVLSKTSRHFAILEEVATQSNASGRGFSDAVLAATAIEHNATLATADSDFKRFKGLNWVNPLDGPPHR